MEGLEMERMMVIRAGQSRVIKDIWWRRRFTTIIRMEVSRDQVQDVVE